MNKKAFTLLELLVVVLIIGILAAIALPQYQLAVDKSRYAALMDITRAIAEANERFYLANDRYSTDFTELDIDISANSFSNNKTTAYFDWGNCRLVAQQEAQCTNNITLKNQYILHYNAGSSNSKIKHFCAAQGLDENSRYNKLCQSIGKYVTGGKNYCYILGDCRIYKITN